MKAFMHLGLVGLVVLSLALAGCEPAVTTDEEATDATSEEVMMEENEMMEDEMMEDETVEVDAMVETDTE